MTAATASGVFLRRLYSAQNGLYGIYKFRTDKGNLISVKYFSEVQPEICRTRKVKLTGQAFQDGAHGLTMHLEKIEKVNNATN